MQGTSPDHIFPHRLKRDMQGTYTRPYFSLQAETRHAGNMHQTVFFPTGRNEVCRVHDNLPYPRHPLATLNLTMTHLHQLHLASSQTESARRSLPSRMMLVCVHVYVYLCVCVGGWGIHVITQLMAAFRGREGVLAPPR